MKVKKTRIYDSLKLSTIKNPYLTSML